MSSFQGPCKCPCRSPLAARGSCRNLQVGNASLPRSSRCSPLWPRFFGRLVDLCTDNGVTSSRVPFEPSAIGLFAEKHPIPGPDVFGKQSCRVSTRRIFRVPGPFRVSDGIAANRAESWVGAGTDARHNLLTCIDVHCDQIRSFFPPSSLSICYRNRRLRLFRTESTIG